MVPQFRITYNNHCGRKVRLHKQTRTSEVQYYYYSYHGTTAPSGPGPLHYHGCTITIRHTTLSRTPLD